MYYFCTILLFSQRCYANNLCLNAIEIKQKFITFCNNIEFYCKLKHFSNSSTLVLIVLWLLLRLNSDTII